VTAGVWVGFDTRETLGPKEQGAKVALPIWMDFMAAAIVGKDGEQFPSANAPKKVLNVDETPSDDDNKLPAADDSDTDNGDAANPDGKAVPDGANSAQPASPIPVAPAVPVAPANGPVIVPAKPAMPKNSPPPDMH
jgi:penicillin-binding protein 1A